MSASQQCHARGSVRVRYLVVFALSLSAMANSRDGSPPESDCNLASVIAHVQEQFRIYGPKSQNHEYFGFVYRVEGELASAVIRGSACRGPNSCSVNTAGAAK